MIVPVPAVGSPAPPKGVKPPKRVNSVTHGAAKPSGADDKNHLFGLAKMVQTQRRENG